MIMASCEKCWRDSRGHGDGEYARLVASRDCTPEQQAGDGYKCPTCKRMTMHMYCHVCMNPECESQPTTEGDK